MFDIGTKMFVDVLDNLFVTYSRMVVSSGTYIIPSTNISVSYDVTKHQ